MKKIFLASTILICTLLAQNNYSTTSNWLVDTNGEWKKFQKVQKHLRGFDMAMVEVGQRFTTLYYAIKDKNFDLAQYQLDKIKKTIQNGIERRPKRAANAKAMFLDTQYNAMSRALASKKRWAAQKEFDKTKKLCNACHKAENVGFIRVITPKNRVQPVIR